MTDLIILAKAAAKIASAQEDGARPVTAHKRALLTEVRTETGDPRTQTAAAEADLPGGSVNPAQPGAKVTLSETGPGKHHLFPETSGGKQPPVARVDIVRHRYSARRELARREEMGLRAVQSTTVSEGNMNFKGF
jgi:hypothetical protein